MMLPVPMESVLGNEKMRSMLSVRARELSINEVSMSEIKLILDNNVFFLIMSYPKDILTRQSSAELEEGACAPSPLTSIIVKRV